MDDQTSARSFASAAAREALLGLLGALQRSGYAFVPATPETHAAWLDRDRDPARSLREVFGWSKPFHAELLADLFMPLRAAGVIAPFGDLWRSRVRVASLDGDLFLHSAFPTDGAEAVFLGPDTYRFVRMLRQKAGGQSFSRVVDLGAGAGVGGLALARAADVGALVLADINPQALALARVNAEFAGVLVHPMEGDVAQALSVTPDLVIANPPFIAQTRKAYSDGGDQYGIGASRDWARIALERLPAGGRLLLYSGAPVVSGRDLLRSALEALTEGRASLSYDEIDPDIFGDERRDPAYRDVERLAAVAVDIRKA